jgi:hypothetical protein
VWCSEFGATQVQFDRSCTSYIDSCNSRGDQHTPVPKVSSVVVHVAEPHGVASLRVAVDGRLAVLNGLCVVRVLAKTYLQSKCSEQTGILRLLAFLHVL